MRLTRPGARKMRGVRENLWRKRCDSADMMSGALSGAVILDVWSGVGAGSYHDCILSRTGATCAAAGSAFDCLWFDYLEGTAGLHFCASFIGHSYGAYVVLEMIVEMFFCVMERLAVFVETTDEESAFERTDDELGE